MTGMGGSWAQSCRWGWGGGGTFAHDKHGGQLGLELQVGLGGGVPLRMTGMGGSWARSCRGGGAFPLRMICMGAAVPETAVCVCVCGGGGGGCRCVYGGHVRVCVCVCVPACVCA